MSVITYTDSVSVEDFNMLHAAVKWNVDKPERVKEALLRTDFLVAARDGERTAGMARVIEDGLQALVADVIVHPDYQHRGIGREMMRRVMEYLNKRAEGGRMLINLMSARKAYEFYEHFGFAARPNESKGPGMTQVLGL